MKLYFSSGYRFFIWLQIGLQFIFPIIATIPISVMAEESPPPLAYSNVITEVAQSLSSDAQNPVKNTATSLIVGESSSVAEKWLGQFGTARISLDVDEHGNWDRSSFDFLYPIYDNEKSLLFTQLGARAPNGRITGNLGLGVRTYHDNNWMFGGNVFFDHDFTGENRRVGIGAEAWTDYLKLSANTYVGTSDWHTSHDFDNYNEKPADGFDIRVETYIPSLPQVGVKGMYEQYYGNEVALFNKEHKQRNPSAITTGLTYTPIPMITTGVDYRLGQQSQDEFKFTLNFRYELGRSLQSQLSPEQVGSYRTLAGSRYNLVERNNEIILQYKEKPQTRTLADISISSVKDNSPADGISQNIVTVHAVDSNGQAIKNIPIIWSIEGNGKLSNYSGITDNNGNLSVAITNTVIEKSLVTAKTGSLIRTIPTNFTDAVATLELSLFKDGAVANGSEQNISQVVVKDSNGNALSDIPINWKLNNGAKITYSDQVTNNEGKALVKFTNISVGSVSVDAQSGEHIGKTTASFVEIPVGTLQVSMLSNNAPADGVSENTAQVVVLDKNGKALPDVEVNWTLSGNAVATTPLSVITGADGIAKVSLTDTSVEAVTVSAQARGQSGKTTASFVEIPVGTLQVSMLSNNAPADGVSENTAQVVV
ncbi:TPA: inverse autotransporter beta domain-containing protein, partial [Providencia alcalifaciens]